MSDSTSGVLDSIDGAIRDYETSKDAMRWAPPESRAATAEALPEIDAVTDIEARIVAWAIGAAEAYMASMRRIGEVMWPILVEACKSMSELAAVLQPVIEARRLEDSAMRREYRRRSLARRRRAS